MAHNAELGSTFSKNLPKSAGHSEIFSDVLLTDRKRLQSLLQRIKHREKSGKEAGREREQLSRQLGAAELRFRQRVDNIPHFLFPDFLPISEHVDEIIDLVRRHQVVLISGETGSGKSTQLPKICLAAGRGRLGSIAHTQPRRIAARSIASRVATEVGVVVGGMVGYRVRFDEKLSEQTLVKVMTDGILLAEIESDRDLLQYDTLIIDEAHERSLNIDFLLGYVKNLLPKRPELRVVITSATLELEKFSEHFGNAPVHEVSGRTYPVEFRYCPAEEHEESADGADAKAVQRGVEEALTDGPGDILVFLPGEREIRESEEHLLTRIDPDFEIIPLYGRLSVKEQQRIFAPHHQRRIVLATNVAETSLTVPGIRYVVDLGLARISRYSTTSKVQRLQVEKVSQSSANQRAGRCGRVADGVCIRLYTEDDYEARKSHTDPEILRTSLASVILRMEAMQLGRMDRFPFIDPPESKQVADGYRLLRELDALDRRNQLTPTGRTLARLPVDPRIGRILLAGSQLGCLREVLVIAAVLETNDPRVVPHELQQQARQYHRTHPEADSDFLALLAIWQDYCAQAAHLSRRLLGQWCEERFLSPYRMREWRDLEAQLRRLSREGGLKENTEQADAESIHKALLAGLLGHVAQRNEHGFYRGTQNKNIALWPASRLARSHESWIVSAELIQTTRLYARYVTAIDPRWIDEVSPHQLRYSHAEPQWSRKDGKVIALESATLWGLTVISGRRVNYGHIEPAEARAIFIRDGLAVDAVDTALDFVAPNRTLVQGIRYEEEKRRCPGMILDDQRLVAFFDMRLPADVVDVASLAKWYRTALGNDPKLLVMARDDLVVSNTQADTDPTAYPDWWVVGESRLPLRYRHNPGGDDDGLTLKLPLYLLNQLSSERVDRMVPGYLRGKVLAMLKSLPKRLRRELVPLPDAVDRLLPEVLDDEQPLIRALIEVIDRQYGLSILEEDFSLSTLSPELHIRIAVTTEEDIVIDEGRNLDHLKKKYSDQARDNFSKAIAPGLMTTGRTCWDFGDLPVRIVAQIGEAQVTAYPALVDEGNTVGVDISDIPARAAESHRLGLHRLMLLQLPHQRRLLNRIPDLDHLCLLFVTVGRCHELRSDIEQAVMDRAFPSDPASIRTCVAFERLKNQGQTEVARQLDDVQKLVHEILDAYQSAKQSLTDAAYLDSELVSDVAQQLSHLVFPGFLASTPKSWLPHLPRFLIGVESRLSKAKRMPDTDRTRAKKIMPFLDKLNNLWQTTGNSVNNLEYRWLLEEFRVSVFAQEIGTSKPVSSSRLKNVLFS